MTIGDRDPIAEEQALGEFWDALTRAEQPSAAALDSSLTRTIQRLHVLDDARAPNPAFVGRLERELMDLSESATLFGPFQRAPRQNFAMNGHADTPFPLRKLSRRERSPRPWTTSLATAALVLITLVGSLVAFGGPLLRGLREARQVFAPDSAETSLAPGPAGDTILLQGTIDEIPPGAFWAMVERVTLAPGAERPLGTPAGEGEGAMLYLVESGELTISADGPISVTRAGEDKPTTVAPETEVVLRAGDRGFTPYGIGWSWRNAGSVPLVAMDTWIAAWGAVTSPQGVSYDGIFDMQLNRTPMPPVTMTVRRQTLAAGEQLVPSQVPGLVGFYVDQGMLQIIDASDGGQPSTSFSIPTHNGRMFGGTGYKAVPPGWTLQSAGSDPVTLLIWTMSNPNPLETAPLG
jgi:hypothetical protein